MFTIMDVLGGIQRTTQEEIQHTPANPFQNSTFLPLPCSIFLCLALLTQLPLCNFFSAFLGPLRIFRAFPGLKKFVQLKAYGLPPRLLLACNKVKRLFMKSSRSHAGEVGGGREERWGEEVGGREGGRERGGIRMNQGTFA